MTVLHHSVSSLHLCTGMRLVSLLITLHAHFVLPMQAVTAELQGGPSVPVAFMCF